MRARNCPVLDSQLHVVDGAAQEAVRVSCPKARDAEWVHGNAVRFSEITEEANTDKHQGRTENIPKTGICFAVV